MCLGSFSFSSSSFSFFGCAEMRKVPAGGDSLGGPIAFQAWGWAWCGLVVAGVFIYCSFFLCLGGWMAWSLWSACDDSGLQMRSRVCGAQGNTPCVGNSTQRRDCNEIPGELFGSQMHTVTMKRPSTFSSELSVGLSRAPCERPSFFSDFEGAACILFCVLECHQTRCFSLIPSWL